MILAIILLKIIFLFISLINRIDLKYTVLLTNALHNIFLQM